MKNQDESLKAPLHERFNLTIGYNRQPQKGDLEPLRLTHAQKVKRLHRSGVSIQELLQGVDEDAWYATYGSTTALIFLAHLLYFKQLWGIGKPSRTRRVSSSRQAVLVSYHKLVRRKRFYLFITAIFSHPPSFARRTASTDVATRNVQGNDNGFQQNNHLQLPTGNQTIESSSMHVSLYFERFRTALKSSPFGPGNLLSGLPLLFYCCHCLWACRALEVLHPGLDYVRMLWTLTWTAFALDLAFTRVALGIFTSMNFAASSPFAVGASLWMPEDQTSPVASRVTRFFTHRTMGSLTATTTATLFVFVDSFNAPLPVLPLCSTKWPVVSWILVTLILLYLSQSTHPLMGVACGGMAGLYWVNGWTSWLSEPYWFYGVLLLYLGLHLLSLKTHQQLYLPCIEYTPWNARGEPIFWDGEGQAITPGSRRDDDEYSSSDESDGHGDPQEEEDMEMPATNSPLTRQRHIHSSGVHSRIRRQDANSTDVTEDPTAALLPAAPSAVRSRRTNFSS